MEESNSEKGRGRREGSKKETERGEGKGEREVI